MTLTTQSVTTDMGARLVHYTGKHVVLTGPAVGAVRTSSGKEYDVTPPVIEVSEKHRGEVAHLISVQVEEQGHPLHDGADEPFVHLCTDACGALRRPDSDPMQAMALVAAQARTEAIADGTTRDEFAAGMGTDSGGPSAARASVAASNAALNGLDGTGTTNVIPFVSLHTADPGTTGANENANAGGYARQACTWNAAAAAAKTNAATLAWTTAGTVAVTHVGATNSGAYGAGTYAIGGALGSAITATSITAAAGSLSLTAA